MLDPTTVGGKMDDYLELREFATTIWRRKWLIALVTLIAAVGAFVISSYMTPVYEATTTLLVNRVTDPRTLDLSSNLTSASLARTYGQLLTARPILQETLSRLGTEEQPRQFKGSVAVRLVPETQLIELRIQDTNPTLAALVANTMVEVFAEENDDLQASRFEGSKASLGAQLDTLREQILSTEARVESLISIQNSSSNVNEPAIQSTVSPESEQPPGGPDADTSSDPPQVSDDSEAGIATAGLDTSESDSRLAELERLYSELAQYRLSYTNMLLSYEELRMAEAQTISTIFQVEPAEIPSNPISPKKFFNAVIAGTVGAAIALLAVFLMEQLDDSIKTPKDVANATGLQVVGNVANSRKLSTRGLRANLMISEANTNLAESFRLLRTNIELGSSQGTPRSILVTSPEQGDGKTTIATQLAVSMAQGGRKVILLDANLRQPMLHKYLEVENSMGLSDMLVDDLVPQVVSQDSVHWRLKIITGGSPVENPAELLGSVQMLKVLTRLRDRADVAIFDSPPLIISDAFILASKLESVLLVMRYGRTRERVVKPIMAQLQRAQANVAGTVMNRVPARIAKALPSNLLYPHIPERSSAALAEEGEVFTSARSVEATRGSSVGKPIS